MTANLLVPPQLFASLGRLPATDRTKEAILTCYDAMQRAIDTGESYRTVLDPPPAHPSLAHPESSRPSWVPVAR